MGNLRYFSLSLILTVIGLALGFILGGPEGLLIVGVLSVLEVSLSFDNAVANATVLQNMDEKWRKRFLTWGMLIAVVGMRILFPMAIVAMAADMSPLEAGKLAFSDPTSYARILTAAHHQVAAFGGAFLMMVFLKFFMDAEKAEHWLAFIEDPLTRLGKLQAVEVALTLVAVVVSSSFFGDITHRSEFLVAGLWGVVVYVVADGLGELMEGDKSNGGAGVVVKAGFMGFMYLELLDASFSFDGVIGAFALTHSLPIIAIGLGVGAMFVRSLTLLLVEKGTLTQYRYLEHGAFWAIGALAAVMLVGVHKHIPEAVTGISGAVLIGLSLWSSIRHKEEPVPA